MLKEYLVKDRLFQEVKCIGFILFSDRIAYLSHFYKAQSIALTCNCSGIKGIAVTFYLYLNSKPMVGHIDIFNRSIYVCLIEFCETPV